MPETYSYLYDTYSLVKNVDESILLFNSIIKDYGYEFVQFGLDELEANFSDLFTLPDDPNRQKNVRDWETGHQISELFYRALTLDPRFGVSILSHKKAFMIKRIEPGKQEVIANATDAGGLIDIVGSMYQFIDSLIQQIRLVKIGDIYFHSQFQIIKNTRKVISRFNDAILRVIGNEVMKFNEEDINILKPRFVEDFSSTGLTELAINNYNLSFEIRDPKTKYMVLMTGIESLFNMGSDQITHTVSRHLALITTSTATDFQKEYKKNKHLYKIRSKIVHGDKPKDFTAELAEVQEKLRKAITFCLDNKDIKDKEQLFDLLNTQGF